MSDSCGLRVLDLFSGAGGFSVGFKQAGYEVVAGIDNWKPALDTHQRNGLGDSLNFDLTKVIGKRGYHEARLKIDEIEKEYRSIDVVIGSPPCTEFSFAKNGGRGDLDRGMLLVRAFLVFVAALKPKFWIMENVPRLKTAILKESVENGSDSWKVPLNNLGVPSDDRDWKWFDDAHFLVPKGSLYKASDYGAPQDRERYIAGHFGENLEQYKSKGKTLGEIISALESSVNSESEYIIDPNYDHYKIPRASLRDYDYDTSVHPMYWEHMRHLKRRHIQYGRIAFPDDMNRPARTVMATINPASRESIVVKTEDTMQYQGRNRPIFRQLKVREAACLQGFPLDFQLDSTSLSIRHKLVGNAVPCQLAYALAESILDAFPREGFEDDEQRKRYDITQKKRKQNQKNPIITPPLSLVDETVSYQKAVYATFRGRKNRHIRRKMASSKMDNKSALVVFENTVWDGNRKHGDVWKSCLQVGVGARFHQIYLDALSIGYILNAIDNNKETLGPDAGKITSYIQDCTDSNSRLGFLKQELSGLFSALDNGLPYVKSNWEEFPGYLSEDTKRYLKFISTKKGRIPSGSYLQKLFTTNVKRLGRVIGPIDLFDSIDAIVLKKIMNPELNWILDRSMFLNELRDRGQDLYSRRISDSAQRVYSGQVPLVTIISSIISVGIIDRINTQDDDARHLVVQSIHEARNLIDRWCNVV